MASLDLLTVSDRTTALTCDHWSTKRAKTHNCAISLLWRGIINMVSISDSDYEEFLPQNRKTQRPQKSF